MVSVRSLTQIYHLFSKGAHCYSKVSRTFKKDSEIIAKFHQRAGIQRSSRKMGTRIIIDCDTGVDDAQSIMMALSQKNVEVVAITCVNGNVDIDNVCQNTLRVLKVSDRLDVPVFKGCCRPLVDRQLDSSHYHGMDGMGDMSDPVPVDLDVLQKEHAVQALLRLVNKSPGEITLVALAPLTNIAVALRLDPDFGKKLKEVVIMGGNIAGEGNTTPASEFNFRADPEAAYTTLLEINCPVRIVPWETCLHSGFSWEWFEEWLKIDTPKGRLNKAITGKVVERQNQSKMPHYRSCDPVAMAVAVDKSIAVETCDVYATIELGGELTRGQMVCDWRSRWQKKPNVTIVKSYDVEKTRQLLHGMVQ